VPSPDAGREETMLDALALLRLQIEWGADEALDEAPLNRLLPRAEPERRHAPEPRRPLAPDAASPPAPAARRMAPGAAPPPRALRGQAEEAGRLAESAADLPALRTAMAGFAGCSLRDTATNLIFAEGDPTPGLVVVGEVPDADEDRAGHPFAGRPGLLLDRMLDSIGLARTGVLLVPLIPWRPPGDRKPSEIELEACLPFLHRILELAGPRRLVLMGHRPVQLLTGTALRGDPGWREVPAGGRPVPALCMRHPGTLLTNPAAKRDAWRDLLRLRKALDEAAAAEGSTITSP